MDHGSATVESVEIKPVAKINIKKHNIDNCSVRDCLDRTSPRHRFPNPKKYLSKFYEWVKLCGISPISITDPLHFRYNRNFVCHRHFTPDCFIGKKIKESAIPQLFLPDDVDLSAVHLPISLPDNIKSNVTLKDDMYLSQATDKDTPGLRCTNQDSEKSHHFGFNYLKCLNVIKNDEHQAVETSGVGINTSLSSHSVFKVRSERLSISSDTPSPPRMKTYQSKHYKEKESSIPPASHPSSRAKTFGSKHYVEENTVPMITDSPKFAGEHENKVSMKTYKPSKSFDPLQNLNGLEIVTQPFEPAVPLELPKSTENFPSPDSAKVSSEMSSQEKCTSNQTTTKVYRSCRSENDVGKWNHILKNSELQNVQVLGDLNSFKDPSTISSILKKAKLGKKGPVYILPMKGEVNGKLTNSKLEEIVSQNTSGLIKEKLLSLLHGKESKRKKTFQKKKRAARKCTCRCDFHCNNTAISNGMSAKLEGSLLNNDSDLFNPCDFVSKFSLSTILTNVNDKYQIEQLCQMMIECIFRLKNINIPKTLGTLTVYLTNNETNSSLKSYGNQPHQEDNMNAVETREEFSRTEHIFNNWSNTEVEIETSNLNEVRVTKDSHENMNNSSNCHNDSGQTLHYGNQSILKHRNIKVNLTAFHDHSYPSLESKFIFEKPEFLVHLIDVNKYKSLKKKSMLFSTTRKVSSPKHLLLKERNMKKLSILKEKLRKKNNHIKLLQDKNKFLKKIIQEKGVKRLRYPKSISSTKSRKNVTFNVSEDKDPWEKFGEVSIHDQSEINPKKQLKRKQKETKNYFLTSIKNKKTDNSNPPKETKSSSPENGTKEILNRTTNTSKRNKIKKTFVPDFDLGVLLDPQTPEYIVNMEPHQNSNFLNSYKALFDALIEEEL